ncbi:hypothetical protein [Hymenobacter cavernae]|nr:hypothetical protein [Hymenobacter cavernae]
MPHVLGRLPAGEEATTCFLRPNQFIMDVESFYSNRPTAAGI